MDMKFILPLLLIAFSGFTQDTPKLDPKMLIAFSGFAQDPPKIDPNTGFPAKKQPSFEERQAKRLASVLQGASRVNVAGIVQNAFSGKTDKQLNDQIETKLELGMKRNNLSCRILQSGHTYSQIVVELDELTLGGRVAGYLWTVKIGRAAYVEANKREAFPTMNFKFGAGIAPSKADLKDDIDSCLEKIFLAYLELPEPK